MAAYKTSRSGYWTIEVWIFVIFVYILLFLSQGPIGSDSALAITIMIWCLVDTKPLPESVRMDIYNAM